MIAVKRVPAYLDDPALPAHPEFQLLEATRTHLGVYAPGTPVRLLSTHGEAVCVCLDPDELHPNGYCHVATVARRHVGLLVTTAGWDAGAA